MPKFTVKASRKTVEEFTVDVDAPSYGEALQQVEQQMCELARAFNKAEKGVAYVRVGDVINRPYNDNTIHLCQNTHPQTCINTIPSPDKN